MKTVTRRYDAKLYEGVATGGLQRSDVASGNGAGGGRGAGL